MQPTFSHKDTYICFPRQANIRTDTHMRAHKNPTQEPHMGNAPALKPAARWSRAPLPVFPTENTGWGTGEGATEMERENDRPDGVPVEAEGVGEGQAGPVRSGPRLGVVGNPRPPLLPPACCMGWGAGAGVVDPGAGAAPKAGTAPAKAMWPV